MQILTIPECEITGPGLVALLEAMTIIKPTVAGAQLRHIDARNNPLGHKAIERCNAIVREQRRFPLTVDLELCDDRGGLKIVTLLDARRKLQHMTIKPEGSRKLDSPMPKAPEKKKATSGFLSDIKKLPSKKLLT